MKKYGHLELAVHDKLEEYRIKADHGREWFQASLQFICDTITVMIDESNGILPTPQLPTTQDRVEYFIETDCRPVERKHASQIAHFKQGLAAHLKVPMSQVDRILTIAGINHKGSKRGSAQVAYGAHPEWMRAGEPGLQLKETEHMQRNKRR